MPTKDKKIKRKEKETGHFMSILYSIMTYVAVLFQSVQLIPSLFHWGTRESFREGFWEWAMHITLCVCETQGCDNLTMCIRARVGCSRHFMFS